MNFPSISENPFTHDFGNTDGAYPQGGLATDGTRCLELLPKAAVSAQA